MGRQKDAGRGGGGGGVIEKKVGNGGAGTRYEVTTATEPGVVPERGWKSTTSQFGHTACTGGQPTKTTTKPPLPSYQYSFKGTETDVNYH